MNAITLVIGAICVLAIAYRLYGIFFTKKVLKINALTALPTFVISRSGEQIHLPPPSKRIKLLLDPF